METLTDTHLRYPIGPFVWQEVYTVEEIKALIDIIEAAPAQYTNAVSGLSREVLKKTYRPGGWNVLQLVHHVADIQLLHFLRMKKALTEPDYTEVTLIDMDGWAKTVDGCEAPPENSLMMMEGVTKRLVLLMRSLTEQDLQVSYYHAVRKYTINQAQAIAMCAWHVQHHLAHIQLALSK